MSRAKDTVFRYFDKQKGASPAAMKTRTLILAMGLAAAVIQFVLTFVYLFLQCPPMVVCTLVGAIASLLCCLLATRWHPDSAGLLLTGGILLVVAADDYFVGNSNNSMLYLFTVLIITILIPYRHKVISILLWALLPLMMAGLYIFGWYHTPAYQLGDAMRIFSVINILVTSGGALLVVGISRALGNYIEEYNQKRIQALEVQSYRDALTKMYNRHYAELHFAKLAAEAPGRTICISIIDLDDFKKVNDVYGHDAGDTALREISRLLRKNLRQSDLVIRWGGEEFVIVLHDVAIEKAHGILDKLRGLVEEYLVVHNEHRFQLTVTMGLGILDVHDVNGSLEICDQKLYEGKRASKNVVVM